MRRLLACLLLCCSHLAAQPATAPAEKVWEFLPPFRGTTSQIVKTLNDPIVELSARLKEKTDALASDERKFKLIEDVVRNQIRETPEYRALDVKRSDAQAEVDRLRGASVSERLRAGERLNAAKKAMEDFEKKRVRESPTMDSARKTLAESIAESSESIARLKANLKSQIEWREQAIAALRGALLLRWPIEKGSRGILGPVRVDALEGTQAIVSFQVFEAVSAGRMTSDGIAEARGYFHTVHLILRGLPTVPKVGETLQLDRMFEVAGITTDFRGRLTANDKVPGRLYLLDLSPDETDQLFDRIKETRTK